MTTGSAGASVAFAGGIVGEGILGNPAGAPEGDGGGKAGSPAWASTPTQTRARARTRRRAIDRASSTRNIRQAPPDPQGGGENVKDNPGASISRDTIMIRMKGAESLRNLSDFVDWDGRSGRHVQAKDAGFLPFSRNSG